MRNFLAADLMGFQPAVSRIESFSVARYASVSKVASMDVSTLDVGILRTSLFVLVNTAPSPPAQQFLPTVQHLLNTEASHLFRIAPWLTRHPELGTVYMLMHVGHTNINLATMFA